MLTRLQVNGFKNLVDFEARFGALTCIAGANGVGKSNIFDAIDFLRRLADETLLDAALGVRNSEGRGDIRELFHHDGRAYSDQIEITAEMLIPPKGVDDLGQDVEASATFLRYELVIGWRDVGADQRGNLEVRKEELRHITKGESAKHLLFKHSKKDWRDHVVTGKGTGHRTAAFISTEIEEGRKVVKLHQDGQGKPRPFLLENLPRTLLSTATKADGATVALARLEMRSWVHLQLEPSAMRAPADFHGSQRMKPNGERLAAALYRLATQAHPEVATPMFEGGDTGISDTPTCSRIANRLAELIDDVDRVWVEKDEKRQVFRLMVRERNGSSFPASSVSDGTLRFLAMAVLEEDPSHGGVICLEEPENGIHPARIPAMLSLLYSIAVDPTSAWDSTNPNRQIIFNTHSPYVVQNIQAEDLLIAGRVTVIEPPKGPTQAEFRRYQEHLATYSLARTWRAKSGGRIASPGMARDYVVAPIRRGPDVEQHDLVRTQLSLELYPAA
jgi:predicted ATPase